MDETRCWPVYRTRKPDVIPANAVIQEATSLEPPTALEMLREAGIIVDAAEIDVDAAAAV